MPAIQGRKYGLPAASIVIASLPQAGVGERVKRMLIQLYKEVKKNV